MKPEEQEEMGCGGKERMDDPEGGWMHGGGMGWEKNCGCPYCTMMSAMKKMGMMHGMGMMGPMGMKHMGMGGWGMGEEMQGAAPWRKFMGSEEKIEKLQGYLKQLQMEEKAVQEKIDFLRKKFEA